ncbi:hypothetical protein [Campylobacter majalis]|uniref:hypothetical protein n=1 Tax=Campylobacter majalis TaxID=2790656 RepID=UPI003D69136D
MKISKILISLAVVAGLSSVAFGYVAMNGSPNINNDTDVVLPISSGDKVLFYILANKTQNDPSLSFVNTTKMTNNDFRCKSERGQTYNCRAIDFYETTLWSSNSVGAKIELKPNILSILKDKNAKIVFLNRINRDRAADTLRNNKPFMKVYIDKDGYLNAEFTRLTGGVSQARTSQPIPIDEPVYIQSNEQAEKYEVGWKGLNSGKTSFGKNEHQIAPIDSDKNANPKPSVSLDITSDEINDFDLEDVYNGTKFYTLLNTQNYFWNTKIDMFSGIDKDVSSMQLFQNNTQLQLDFGLLNRIIHDLNIADENSSKLNFPSDTMRVYSIPDFGLITDIREKR